MSKRGQLGLGMRIELQGIRKAIKDVKKFKNPDRLKVIKKAFRKAGAIVLAEIRRQVKRHHRSGTLYKSLKSKLKYYKNHDTLVVFIGVQSWFTGEYKGKKVVAHNIAHLVRDGHKAFTQTIKVQPGKKYMVRGKSGLNVITNKASNTIRIRRRVGAARGDDFIAKAVTMTKTRAIDAARKVVEKELFKRNNP